MMYCAICALPCPDEAWLDSHMHQAHPLTTRIAEVQSTLTEDEKTYLLKVVCKRAEYIEHYERRVK